MKRQIHQENASKPKERRIVTWTQQEDDILREQIRLHGTDNWTSIASKLNDKTTRQCRRRWYTYLNSDFKTGGWSPEEDMLLCEAQKMFGNKWTEIAKVVSGRTDNAVKNRFSTLCKKKAKLEALNKENSTTSINTNNKRVLVDSRFCPPGLVDVASPFNKLRRAHIPNSMENLVSRNQLRPPLAELAQNDVVSAKDMVINGNVKEKTEGTFLRKDDPKVAALVKQAELLSSLAVKVNMDNTEQSLENAWKILQSYFDKSKVSDKLKCNIKDAGFQLDDFKELMGDLRSKNNGIQLNKRKTEVYECSSSPENSTGSISVSEPANDQGEQSEPEVCTHDDAREPLQTLQVGDQEASSPALVTPIFRSLASTIPSPQFSESEKHFLLKTLGIKSPPPNNINNHLQPPQCRKALLQGL